ncbi:MAG: recombinase family protein, partial [Sulfolobales archaeon]
MIFRKPRAIGYARVSLESENIENQVLEIEKFAGSQGFEVVEVFKDVGVSGSKPALEREGFKQMLEASKLLNTKTIICYDLTRLGRDLFDLVNTYKFLLEQGYTVLFVKHPELNAKPN